ncbi:condensin complex subunit SMC2 [Cantharellus anzutake]|uniref:condensin complex subunit SMC2 n=1 Tax=Cantharellus anzutake TaxID=1750568 RepID=UPI0019042A22|nr:condensin complex subunit SMC2 [Cantharellus anzutake]KAF8337439.1 condensin complex subunit SMC2 [Cantharellus anzutake]
MRIEELVIEGFKSYPVRTTISGWDSSFNAITGLNGSGKSNILDAICFVLGITNMQQMRAQNQQDLIYKRGQAGITKASVTIVFDNSDKSASPAGLENSKQITLTRQIALPNITKYILNGHKVQQQAVLSLLQSVQLNINNPNFVIMQGRITKVLNMRPQEILGMMEEAAGTRMFEDRKEKAKKTMGKKEKRVEEITSLLQEEITPKLDKLREQKRSFLTFQKTTSELERLARFLRAYDWVEANSRVSRKDTAIREKKTLIQEAQHETEVKEREGAEAEKERARRQGASTTGTQAELMEGTITEEEKKVNSLEQALVDLRASLEAQRSHVDERKASYASSKESHQASQARLASSEELLQTLVTGLSSAQNASSAGGYLGQLAEAKARLTSASAAEEQIKMRIEIVEKELKEKEAKWKTMEKEAKDGSKALEKARSEMEALTSKLQSTGWDLEKEEASNRIKDAKEDVRSLTEKRDVLANRLAHLEFTYSSPSPSFDHSKVKGLVAKLIELPEDSSTYSTALEVSAGGKLYNVVVEDETVGTQLLAKGNLKKRVTIIPLNKINAFRVSAEKLAAVQKVAPNKAHLALSLVGYSEDVAQAMAYVFGDTIICDDAASAKAVTFNKAIAMKSVTAQGDVYDPSGLLSGGSAPSGSGTLLRVQELHEAESRLTEAIATLKDIEKAEALNQARKDSWRRLERELEIKTHELRLLEEQVGASNASRLGAEVENLKGTLVELRETMGSAKQKQQDAKNECKKLERDMDEFKNNKDSKLKELKSDIAKQKSALSKEATALKTLQKETQTATLEYEQTEKDIDASQHEVEEARASVQTFINELKALEERRVAHQAGHDQIEAKLKKERAELSRFDDELRELDLVIKEKRQADAEHSVTNLQKERAAAANAVTALEKGNPWIESEREHFGKPGTVYDFGKRDVQSETEKARELEDQLKGMRKTVNPKVMGMIETVEKKEAELLKMLSTVLKDKEKIEDTIAELERHKRDALQKTWNKVNADFGAIFAELLPGNFAKLQPPEGMDLTQGLEVKVQLGSVWKQSLTELSGGQRSLIALSLIMALLQFKPAPMYILDEIDAALDLSHTQHIGQLFKNRFKGSQFIVVSLKEGLFTNANVLFRAQFRDGTSVVTRTAQRSASSIYDPGKENSRPSARTK